MVSVVKKKLKWIQSVQGSEDPETKRKIKNAQLEVDEILDKENLRWKQRAKANWL